MSGKSEEAAELVVITGLSGSGKTLAMRALEDLSFYCVDNLPLELVPTFYELCRTSGREISRVGLVVDIRGGEGISDLPSQIEQVRAQGQGATLLFLEATDEVLLRRFDETRRPHPLSAGKPLEEAISEERRILAPVKESADLVLDTSVITPHELRDFIYRHFREGPGERLPRITVSSFGFKHGGPGNADLVFDVRFLPNPHFVEGLREKTGKDAEIVTFLEESELYRDFRSRLLDLLEFLLPAYTREGKTYLDIAFGCTGGRHRSVTMARQVADALSGAGYHVDVRHRDVGKS
jgi:UPF0042 nucleotide-binding protein